MGHSGPVSRKTIERRLQALLSTAEVAEELGSSPQYIRRLAKKHGIGIRLGGRRVYARASLRYLRRLLKPVGRPKEEERRPAQCGRKRAAAERSG